MDKIQKRLPIKSRAIKQPVVFTFNILLNHYLGFRTQQYNAIQKIIQKYNKVDNFYLLPNITNVSMTIESRAAQLSKQLSSLSKELNNQKLHVITHSFCGIDCRAAISLYGANSKVSSLTTVCTPHHGLKLIDHFQRHENSTFIEMTDKAFEAVGISQKNSQEFTPQNIKDFNNVAENRRGVDYYSIGAQKAKLQCSDLLRHSHEVISEGMVHNRSDGIVRPEEAHWGKYLVTYEQDHLEMAGFNADYVPLSVYTLAVDNIRLSEIKSDPQEAKQYGVDHLFSHEY